MADQDVVETVDDLLKDALKSANVYMSHDEVRPSAKRAFDKVEDARMALDEIDEREFTNDE